MQHRTILIVDDDKAPRLLFKKILSRAGYSVLEAENAEEALAVFKETPPDLVLLDLYLTGEMKGLALCEELRRLSEGRTYILAITGFPETDLDIKCLQHGADGYLTKPVEPDRLVAYVEALLRRTPRMIPVPASLQSGPLEIDLGSREVKLDGKLLAGLTLKEFDLLALLVKNYNRVVERKIIAQELWGRRAKRTLRSRTIDTHVKTLRTKLGEFGKNRIHTLPGIGLKFISSSETEDNRISQ